MDVRKAVPWQAKIPAKLLLSRIPLNGNVWRRVGIFRHGLMDEPDYAYGVVRAHFERAGLLGAEEGLVVLEIGPGDSMLSAMVAHSLGASRCYMVDVGAFARRDLEPYQRMAAFLARKGQPAPDLEGISSPEQLLATCNAEYLTQGLSSLRDIRSGSVDLVWSQAVLEHIRRAEFLDTMAELRRIVSKKGICSHRIDLSDHLQGGLNSLRFSDQTWESDFMAKSGFYTNRIRFSEMLRVFEQSGFRAEVTSVDRWPALPTAKRKMSREFARLLDEELCVSGFDVLLRPA